MARHKIGRSVATLAQIGQEAREIANNQIVLRKVDIARWHGAPGDGFFDAAGQPLNKPIAEMDRIESVKDLGTMRLDLREQDVLERRLSWQSDLSRPGALKQLVVPVCEECIRIGAGDRK